LEVQAVVHDPAGPDVDEAGVIGWKETVLVFRILYGVEDESRAVFRTRTTWMDGWYLPLLRETRISFLGENEGEMDGEGGR
jgi:hypothetical protein